MSDRFSDWLQSWGDWLEGLLATGIGCPSEETCELIRQWCGDAELLGFATQVEQARLLLGTQVPVAQRHLAFLDLLLEQDMLVRLDAAQALLKDESLQ